MKFTEKVSFSVYVCVCLCVYILWHPTAKELQQKNNGLCRIKERIHAFFPHKEWGWRGADRRVEKKLKKLCKLVTSVMNWVKGAWRAGVSRRSPEEKFVRRINGVVYLEGPWEVEKNRQVL